MDISIRVVEVRTEYNENFRVPSVLFKFPRRKVEKNRGKVVMKNEHKITLL